MNDLLWWHGITWQTPLNQIGWSYVVMIILGGIATHFFKKAMRP